MNDNRPDKLEKRIRIYIIILIIVTVGVTAWGAAAHTSRGYQETSHGNDTDGAGSYVTDAGSWNAEENVTSIDAETELIDIRIVTGDSLHAEWGGTDGQAPSIRIENGVLKIRQAGSAGRTFPLINLSVSETEQPWIRVTVPEGTAYEEISIKAECGDIRIGAVNSKRTDVKADVGDIRLEGGNLGRLTVEADCGNIELNSVKSGDAEIKTDIGRIYSYQCSHGLIDIKADCGEIRIDEVTAERGKIKSDVGDIEISGDFPELNAECSFGKIDVTTDRPEQDVRLNLKTDTGAVTVNGKTNF